MSIEHVQFIKGFRIQRGFSQLEIAEKLGISRSSYIAVEQGKRELTLSEAQKLADLYGITLKDMESGIVPNYDKYKEMILAYLRTAAPEDGKIPKTKLAKLLYLADFAWFYDHFQSMSGMQYRRNHFGPVPDMYFRAIDELNEEGRISIDCSKEDIFLISENVGSEREKLETISKDEMSLIEDISKKWKDKRTKEIVDFTHRQLPYRLCGPEEFIPYELITQEDPDYVY